MRLLGQRDAVVQIIIGQDLPLLDGVAQFREMGESDRIRFRTTMLQKYRSGQQSWQKDRVVGTIMEKDWWLK